ncbi:MAG: DUF4290 domain-containing protein [Paludibacteraceae bacterium]|nr:DUF4290 domain-containing protein [Paludibacteraceae bacterium]
MDYNTQMEKLILPEYGRNIQNMVNHCLTIEDREERTACAYAIVNTMGNLFPQLRDLSDFKHILWDHLAIMSNFKLDIDYPYEVIKEEKLNTKPERIEYSNSENIRFVHYGKLIHSLIEKAIEMEQGEERDQLEIMIANYMKKSYITFNKDGVDDLKIFDDLAYLSKENILLHNKGIKLADYKNTNSSSSSSKKKKKK